MSDAKLTNWAQQQAAQGTSNYLTSNALFVTVSTGGTAELYFGDDGELHYRDSKGFDLQLTKNSVLDPGQLERLIEAIER